jgi:glycosyltransferase involved in cell wall biosynthesis
MRILIDAVPLLVRSAGVKHYLYHWISELRRMAGGEEIRVFPFLGEFPALDHERSVAALLPTLFRQGLLYAMNRTGPLVADCILPRADIFHTAKLLHPPRRPRLTATIHDMTAWLMPEVHLHRNVEADRQFADHILRRADGIIAVSESARQDAIRILKLRPERIRVVHHGVEEAFRRAGAAEAAEARMRYGLKRPYLLFVGTVEPRKNLDLLLDAYLGLAESLRDEFQLVVSGPMGWARPETAARLSASPGVRYLGYVPERYLPGLFAGATAFAYVSLYEGFGMPLAQALAAGLPVVTANVSAMPEVVGPAGLLADPRSEAEIRAALDRLLSGPSLRAGLAAKARKRAEGFTWERCARESLEFFREAGG